MVTELKIFNYCLSNACRLTLISRCRNPILPIQFKRKQCTIETRLMQWGTKIDRKYSSKYVGYDKLNRLKSFYVSKTTDFSSEFSVDIMHRLYYIKNQQDATLAVIFISNCKITLHVSDALCPHHQEYLKLY
jgi:hypothetical protein